MADSVRLVDPQHIQRNVENPRLVFRTDELQELEDSIRRQGILVPLTVFELKRHLVILDGERRWRCALRLGLETVPVIVQPEPTRLQNIMMMFAIHHTRKEWDPLPTAMKLQELELEFIATQGRKPSETELAQLGSMKRGEVRRLKKLLGLPDEYREELRRELEKPRSAQVLTVDHVLEATRGAEALRKRSIVSVREEDQLRKAIISKFKAKVIKSTVDPRKLARMARAVDRGEVELDQVRAAVRRIIREPKYSVDDAFEDSVSAAEAEHSLDQLAARVQQRLESHLEKGHGLTPSLKVSLQNLRRYLDEVLGGIR